MREVKKIISLLRKARTAASPEKALQGHQNLLTTLEQFLQSALSEGVARISFPGTKTALTRYGWEYRTCPGVRQYPPVREISPFLPLDTLESGLLRGLPKVAEKLKRPKRRWYEKIEVTEARCAKLARQVMNLHRELSALLASLH